jgi:acetyltransferase-like isoleucine patch superfamily enzyme
MKIGIHSAVCRNLDVRSAYRVSIGSYSTVNKCVLLDGRGGKVKIGNSVDIAQECNIWTLQHDYNSPSYKTKGGNVVIEDYVWLASRVTVLPGVTIGKGSVIGTCSVVTKDIPPMSIAVGIPAKVIAKRDDCLKYKLGKRGWFR